MSLNHINLYLLEGNHGWTIIDTGIRGEDTRDHWHTIFENCLGGKPVNQVICTHMHPDHTGQAGFLTDRWHAPLLMSYSEYYQTRVMNNMMRDGGSWQMGEYFERAGVSPDFLEQMAEMRSSFAPQPEDLPLPSSFTRLSDGEHIQIGGNTWDIITGNGHSPEHVCLYSRKLGVLISGDQILPVITSNVSVSPTEPFGNPMVGWLESHEKFKAALPNDVLVLPAHNEPFYGLHERLQELIDHHEDRMLILEENCIEPKIAVDLLPLLFKRKLEGPSMFMGLGECIAHLHCLMTRGRIERTLDDNRYYYRSIDLTLSERATPGRHEEPEEFPIMI
jgi:glyoxylase-like metal-dependent hydrolase (beta-lactamase superfamily II)